MTREFGVTAFGRAWLRRIEPVTVTGVDRDLVRARSLARRGVGDPVVDGSRVRATVTERGREHAVALAVPAWDARERALADRALAGHDPGDPSDEAAAALAAAGVGIAPDPAELAPGSEVRRAHLLAVCYRLVRCIDEDPRLAIALRAPDGRGPRDPDLIPLAEVGTAGFYG
ncbi:hypothetical protein [Nocardiopsis sp. CC223A]|uniref:hypothetical protein n=1 Tax=Nocardiopsis sp. CC223A TaxID=3044051 RepID=UPI00278C847A|nr:hypothetical protein [Nocardiopsis sp. CC223A]